MRMRFLLSLLLMILSVSGAANDNLKFSNGTVGEYQLPIREGDFGRDAFGWLEACATKSGMYVLSIGEQRKTDGTIDANPAGTIRGCVVTCEVSTAWTRVPLVADERNTKGRNGGAMAVVLPPEVGVVMPFRYVDQVAGPGRLSFRRMYVHWPMKCKVSCPLEDLDVRKSGTFASIRLSRPLLRG